MRQTGLYIAVVVFLVAALTAVVSMKRWSAVENRTGSITTRSVTETEEITTPQKIVESENRLMFADVTADSGIEFNYYGGPSTSGYMTEQNGGGIALFDFDHDGTLDVYLVNGSRWDRGALKADASSRLFRSTGKLCYTDVTKSSITTSFGFGMGAAAGDYDNDGFVDLFIAYYGQNRLFRNEGDGTFADVTEASGVGDDELWSSSAAFADLDNDGLLDLYVVNYIDWTPETEPCTLPEDRTRKIICSPVGMNAQPDSLFRNDGNGEFSKVVREAFTGQNGIGKGLALTIADFDSNGLLDVYVVNDTTRNQLWKNKGGMSFSDEAVADGVAVSASGIQGAGMGVATADFNRNGHLDLCVSNFRNQVNDLYSNLGEAGFIASNETTGLDLISRTPLSFGVVFADFDLDGWPDLFVANGHIWDKEFLGPQYSYRMKSQVIRNFDGRRFRDVSEGSGEYFQASVLGRAAVTGDLDNDGDFDLLVQHLQSKAAVLRNDTSRAGGGLRVELIGIEKARQPRGVSVHVRQGTVKQRLHVSSGESFQACHDPRLLVAVRGNVIDEITVDWGPDSTERWRNIDVVEGTVRLIEGTGTPLNAMAK